MHRRRQTLLGSGCETHKVRMCVVIMWKAMWVCEMSASGDAGVDDEGEGGVKVMRLSTFYILGDRVQINLFEAGL